MFWWLWLAVGIILLAVEAAVTRDFTFFCIGTSSILVGLITVLGISQPAVQWVCFGLISAAMLYWVRDWLRQARPSEELEEPQFTNIVGQTALPLDDLAPFGFGKVELSGVNWEAHNAGAVAIPRGCRCRVLEVKGLTVWILPE